MAKYIFIFFLLFVSHTVLFAQPADTSNTKPVDTVIIAPTIFTAYQKVLQNTVYKHQYLNVNKPAISFVSKPKKNTDNAIYFYILATLTLILGCIKAFYSKYFTTLFNVFFNSSLRQSQLTDQLLQAKLPSLLYNTFFIVSGGIFIYIILRHYNASSATNSWLLLFLTILILAIIYVVKFASLKFTGWVTGYSQITNTYTFVLFLINKILGILLVPFSIGIAFLHPTLTNTLVMLSLCCVAFMFSLRFFKSYGLVQGQLKINYFHFFLYIVGIEILPLLLVYKGLMYFLAKNA